MKKRVFMMFTLLGILLVGSAFFLTTEKSKVVPLVTNPSEYNAQEDLAFWVENIQENDATLSYQKFVENNKKAPIGVQHIRAHVIGEVLFETEGITGISICDSNFGFGCFHGLFTVGFASEGRSFVKEADTECVERYGVLGTGCQHGIGHGIVEYVGRDRLGEALALCEETSQPTPLLGCTSGVFMESNTPFTVFPNVEQLEPYPYSEEKPYAACESVSEKYKTSCYYELGGWWEVVLQGDKNKMGELCSNIQNKKFRDSCALGLGNIIGPTSGYSVEKSSALCANTPENVTTLCFAGVAWSLFSNPIYSTDAEKVCESLSEKEAQICQNTYNLAKNPR